MVMSARVDRPRATVVVVAGDGRRIVTAVGSRVACDLDLVDRLLWLRLVARRLGWLVSLEDVDDDLADLLDLVGVAALLSPTRWSR
jgi:hypothetical protein